MAIKSLSIRIDTEMLDKLHVVADYEGRSANSQINILQAIMRHSFSSVTMVMFLFFFSASSVLLSMPFFSR